VALLKQEAQEVTHRIADERWGRAAAQSSEYGVLRGWRNLTTGFADPVRTAREFLIDPFRDVVDIVAKELDVATTLVECAVALALCPPMGLHITRENDESAMLVEVAQAAAKIRKGLLLAADRGSISLNVADRLTRRAGLDALAAVALGYRAGRRAIARDAIFYRPNALLVAAVYIEDVSRWACSQLNKMLYGQLAPADEDPFTAILGNGFGLEIAHSLAIGGCAGAHDDARCTRRRHDIRLWDPSAPDEPPSLFYWLSNLLVGARASAQRGASLSQNRESTLVPQGVQLQAGALKEGILPYQLNIGVLKALILRCRECGRKLDGVSTVCLGKLHATNDLCDVYVQFDDKRVLLNPVPATPTPIRCQTCSGAVDQIGLNCPGCGELVSGGRRSVKTYIPEEVTHPFMRAFARRIDRSESEEAVVDALCRGLRRANSVDADIKRLVRLVADELDEDVSAVIEIAERHGPTLRACLAESE
jgi:hypothetical protein